MVGRKLKSMVLKRFAEQSTLRAFHIHIHPLPCAAVRMRCVLLVLSTS